MILLNPIKESFAHLDPKSAELMKKTVGWFESRGKTQLKEDDHERVWYTDFLQFIKKEQIFYRLLTPAEYGDGNTRWDTYRICQFNEILGFYGLTFWYVWQVSILGLSPIWMSSNEDVKKKTAQLLKMEKFSVLDFLKKSMGQIFIQRA